MNSSRLAILTLVLGLGIGFGIGLLKGGASGGIVEAAGPGGAAPSAVGPAATRGASSAPTTLAAVGDSAPSASSGSSASGPAASAEAKRLAKRVSVDAKVGAEDASTWNGVIRGSVLNELGEPLPGATVISNNNHVDYRTVLNARSTGKVGRAFQGLDDIDESMEQSAEALLKNRRHLRTATTDADGQFELTGLKDGTHRLSVHAEGYTFGDDLRSIGFPYGNHEHEVGSTIEIVGKPVVVFALDVRQPDGTVPDEAVVTVASDRAGSGNSFKWTAAEPEMRLSASNIEFRVFAGNVRRLNWSDTLADFASTDQSLNSDRDGAGPHLVQLEASQLCQVHVSDTSGIVPTIQPWVKIVAADAGAAPDFKWSKDTATALTREVGGDYVTKDLPEGSYLVGIGRGGNKPEVTEPLQVLAGFTALEVSLGELELSRFLVVKCTGPNGRPTNDMSFSSTRITESGSSRNGNTDALKRGQGEYWISTEGLLQGSGWDDVQSVRLSATSMDYGTIDAEVPQNKQELLLAFSMPCELEVFVAGDHSDGYRATITEHVEDDTDSMNRRFAGFASERNSKKVDADGRVLFTGKQPGQYEISLTKSGHGGDRYSGWGKPVALKEVVTLREGTNQVTLTLPTFHTLTVFAPGQRKGSNLMLRPDGASQNDYTSMVRVKIDENERATFKDVAAGTYSLSGGGSRSSGMTVTVPCGEVTLEIKESNSLIVSNLVAGKAGAKAGLKNGDILMAMDGKPLEGRTASQRATMKMMTSSVNFTVRRGNADINVVVGPIGETEEAMANMGFSIRPYRVD